MPIIPGENYEQGVDDDGTPFMAVSGVMDAENLAIPYVLLLYADPDLEPGALGQAILFTFYADPMAVLIGGRWYTGRRKVSLLPRQGAFHFGTAEQLFHFVTDDVTIIVGDNPVEYSAEFALLGGWASSLRNLQDASDTQIRRLLKQSRPFRGLFSNFVQRQRGGLKRSNEWQNYIARWEAAGFSSEARRALRAEYLASHSTEAGARERFDRYMRGLRAGRIKSA